ncbi:type II toxin-antitoxin system VapC family toxin [Prosthecobacter sp. SYSU 5D2]|uniref:type II toxin-antitoxin system VapC family toxin n=1 Tax=Prosthecobacter sp. SYSU 5D2 TaxID=3134134 RepID=UPI0031FECADD
MVLADTNVWVYFLNGKNNDQKLGQMLWAGEIVTHWIVIGELAVRSVADRQSFLTDLRALERVEPATEREALVLIENRRLYGRGIGWNDIQLLASCLIHQVPLWTHDRRLKEAAQELGCAWKG